MSEELSDRLQRIFLAARDLEPAAREDCLSRECAADPTLRTRVERLLDSHDRAEGFLERPALGTGFHLESRDSDFDAPPELAMGTRLGPYRIKGLIGAGGMASVYLAERADQEYQRQVALKLIRPGIDSEAVITRFRLERQALATLDHPHIARLFDGGTTAEGVPYLVMEYIEGQPITSFCEAQVLDVAGRLELFNQVCSAVQYAHRNLILHRDLKPSNILVTGEGTAKLLDFGIAKLLAPGAAAVTVAVTTTTQRFFTPDYASPEQIRGEPVSTASDVYSLGVLLYELLCGERPYQLTGCSPRELETLVCEQDPLRPSHRIDPAHDRLRRSVEGDLDNIVMKALRKEPDRRYQTVELMASDVCRHLQGRPVLARPQTVGYRAAKFVRRHRVGVAAVLAVVLALAAGLVLASLGLIRSQRALAREGQALENLRIANQDALHQRNRAVAEAATQRRISEFLGGLFEAASPWETPESDPTVGEILDRGAQRIVGALEEDPLVRVQLMTTLGETYRDLTRYDKAQELLETAVGEAREKIGADDPVTLKAMLELGKLLYDRSDYAAAGPVFEELSEAAGRVRGEESLFTLSVSSHHAALLETMGEFERAAELIEQVLEIRRRPGVAGGPAELLKSMTSLASCYAELGRYQEAHDLLLEVVDGQRGLENRRDLISALITLADVKVALGRSGESVEQVEEAVEASREVFGPGHHNTLSAISRLATVYALQGQVDQAELWFRELVDVGRESLGVDHKDTLIGVGNLGYFLLSNGRPEEARPLIQESLEGLERRLGPDHPEVLRTVRNLGRLHRQLGESDAALACYEKAWQGYTSRLGPQHAASLQSGTQLAQALLDCGDDARAEQLLRDSHTGLLQAFGLEHGATLECMQHLGKLLLAQGRFDEAGPILLAALTGARRTFGVEHIDVRRFEYNLALFELARGRPEDALVLVNAALERLSQQDALRASFEDLAGRCRAARAGAATDRP